MFCLRADRFIVYGEYILGGGGGRQYCQCKLCEFTIQCKYICSPQSGHNFPSPRFAPEDSCILLRRVSTKVVKRIAKFEILNLGQISLFFFLFGFFLDRVT